VRAAEREFRSGAWRSMNTRVRGRVLLRLAELIREHRDELARLESRNVGKPIRESRDEVDLAADCFEFYAGTTNKIAGQTIPGAASLGRRAVGGSSWRPRTGWPSCRTRRRPTSPGSSTSATRR